MAFTLNIDTDNAAFEEDEPGIEIARILREAARTVENGSGGSVIHDSNGNRVGKWELS